MGTRTTAFITPTVVRWARERIGASSRAIAEKLNANVNQVELWELGEDFPTIRQAQKLAKTLHVPFGYLFLSSPPEEKAPLPDFRTLHGSSVAKPSPELVDVINDVLAKQDLYRELQMEDGAESIPFVGRYDLSADKDVVAANIAHTLEISAPLRKASASWDDFLRKIVANAELKGILVMRSGIVCGNTRRSLSPEEFRGFAISDGHAPVIFINGADALAAQIFTFVHEAAHIWLGETGISNPSLIEPPSEDNIIERFCDTVAAEVLVPASEFLQQWKRTRSAEDNLKAANQYFRVSSLVVLRRAHDLRKISTDNYIQRYKMESQRFERQQQNQEGGGNAFFNIGVRNSKTFTRVLIGAALDGRVPYREAAQLLNVRVPTIQKIAEHLSAEGS